MCCRSAHSACIANQAVHLVKGKHWLPPTILYCTEVALMAVFWVLFMNEQIWQALIFAWSCVAAGKDF